MGKIGRTLIVLLLVLMTFVFPVVTGYAQTPTTEPATGEAAQATATPAAVTVVTAQPAAIPLPPPEDVDSVEMIPFQWLGLTDQTMTGPYDATSYLIGLPAYWQLIEGTQLELNIFHSLTALRQDVALPGPENFLATLDVYFNNKLISTIPLNWTGEQKVIVPVPADALTPTAPDQPHQLLFVLTADYECLPGWYTESGLSTTVAIRGTSSIFAPHTLMTPSVDLRLLPFPISQRSFMPNQAVLVVPDGATPQELQAALAISAGMGQMTNGNLDLTLVPVSQLTPEMQNTRHLILVGKADSLPILGQVAWAVTPDAASFGQLGAGSEDGIIEMAVSPWAPSKVVLLATGATDQAVAKAGQAISAGSILVAGQPNVAVVSDVVPQVSAADTMLVDRSLADLGYSYYEMNGIGIVTANFRFDVKPGLEPTEDAYFDLYYNHSGFMDFTGSGLSIRINDQSIGSATFDPQSQAITKVHFVVPRSAVRQGRNTLSIEAFLLPYSVCAPYNLGGVWVTIQPESLLHLPLQLAKDQPVAYFDLSTFPEPFVASPILLSNTAFIVPSDDAVSWDVASSIAYSLGQQANKMLADLVVAFADSVPEDVKSGRHLLVIGRPSQLPILAEIKDAMPVPFEAGSDMPKPQNDLRVDYYVSADSSLGFLELAAAPWNNTHEILTVLGNTDEGTRWAGAALTTSRLRGQLAGNFATISGDQVTVSYFVPAGVAPATAPTPEAAAEAAPAGVPTPVPPATIAGHPTWVIPVLVVTTALMVLLVIVLLIAAARRK